MKKVLKYLARIFTYTLLTILIVCGLSLLFVFVTSKVSKAKGAEPPINLLTIISPSMTPNVKVYDVVVTIKTDVSKIKVGDIISFYSSNPNVNGISVTHRVAQVVQNGSEYFFRTKGDANLSIDAEPIAQDKVMGKVYFKIPQLGRVQFFLGSKGGWLIAILLPALAIISYDIYKIIKLIIVKQKIKAYQSNKAGAVSEGTEVQNVNLQEINQDLEAGKLNIEIKETANVPIEIPQNIEPIIGTDVVESNEQKNITKDEEVVEEKIDELLTGEENNSEPVAFENDLSKTDQEEIVIIE